MYMYCERFARMKALTAEAAAWESTDFEKLMAEKEHKRRKHKAEIERTREQERTQPERGLAILAAIIKVAIVDAKLKAIEETIERCDH